MKKLLHYLTRHITLGLTLTLTFTVALTLTLTLKLSAQHIYDGMPGSNTSIGFSSTTVPGYIPDSAATPLWQIGRTTKSYFTTSPFGVAGIMTDTSANYPINANNFFILKLQNSLNLIVDIWHRYETDSAHDGGIVEYSIDHGATWQNVKGDCNADSGSSHFPGTLTDNFYGVNDTLATGDKAFSGNSHGAKFTRVQFFTAIPIRTTSGGCGFMGIDSIYLRFRFVSDSTADSYAGWMIDSIQAEHDIYIGGVTETSRAIQLPISPNPSTSGLFTFPELKNEDNLTITITNAIGQKIIETPYKRSIDLGNYPAGMYIYRVNGDDKYYNGRLIYR